MSAYQELFPILIFIIVAFFIAVAIAVFGKILSITIGVNQPNLKKKLTIRMRFSRIFKRTNEIRRPFLSCSYLIFNF